MGNSQSGDTPKSPSSSANHGSAPPTPSSQFIDDSKPPAQLRQQGPPRKAQTPVSKPSTPLTQSLVTSGGSASTSTSSAHAHATVSASPQRSSHNRVRSMTASGSQLESRPSSMRTDLDVMSTSEPKSPRPISRSSPMSPTSPSDNSPARPDRKTVTFPVSQPVDVPLPAAHTASSQADSMTGYSESPYGLPPANYSRPPRLPLPIEEEVHTPGSPIITPQDVLSPLDANDVEGALPRKASVLSQTTVDEDEDLGDNDAFAEETSQDLQLRIPTRLEWNGGGEKIFVTGTFCNWEKKMKLHRNKGRPGFSAYVMLPPGTHHIKFLMDGEMVTSNDLPTTVDWTNILVNYIEISAPLPPEPAAVPAVPHAQDEADTTEKLAAAPLRDEPEEHIAEATTTIPPTVHAEKAGLDVESLPKQQPSPAQPIAVPAAPQDTSQPQSGDESAAPPSKQMLPRSKYTNQIPDYLLDLDSCNNPEDERLDRATKVTDHLPRPPSLPMFISKSILNSSTPHKDDASVLVMPNHTVLNHLATSSIKSGVLATSGTTRYKRKFLTTIIYRPTSDGG